MTQATRPASSNVRGRNLSIDSLRGIAIILMVAGHVIGSGPERGMGVTDDSLWRYFSRGLEDIRMPLFAALSGYIYALRPISHPRDIRGLAKGKARRLLVPLITVGTLFFFTQLLVPGTNRKPEITEFWQVFVFGIEHLWFVQATFLMFVIMAVLDAFDVLRTFMRWSVVVLASSLIFIFVTIPTAYDIFSVSGAIRLLPFFLLGYGLNKFSVSIRGKSILAVSAAAFVFFYIARILTFIGNDRSDSPAIRTLMLGVGIFAVTIIMLMRAYVSSSPLAWLGQFSFGIYLLHVFGSAGARMLLGKAGIENDVLVFGVCMIAAVSLPVLFEQTFGRLKFISWGILGQRPRHPGRP